MWHKSLKLIVLLNPSSFPNPQYITRPNLTLIAAINLSLNHLCPIPTSDTILKFKRPRNTTEREHVSHFTDENECRTVDKQTHARVNVCVCHTHASNCVFMFQSLPMRYLSNKIWTCVYYYILQSLPMDHFLFRGQQTIKFKVIIDCFV